MRRPILPKMHRIAQICTYIFKKKFQVETPEPPITGKKQAPPHSLPPLDARPPSHIFRASAAAVLLLLTFPVISVMMLPPYAAHDCPTIDYLSICSRVKRREMIRHLIAVDK